MDAKEPFSSLKSGPSSKDAKVSKSPLKPSTSSSISAEHKKDAEPTVVVVFEEPTEDNHTITPSGDYVDWSVVDDNVDHSHDTSFDTTLERDLKPIATARDVSTIETVSEEYEDTLEVGIEREEHDPEFQDTAGLHLSS